MSRKGLYVDVWREGLKTKTETDQLLLDCAYMGITDLYVHMHRDIVSQSIEWDYLSYILQNKKDIRVHIWFPVFQLGRKNSFTLSAYESLSKIDAIDLLFLDPTSVESKSFIVKRISDFIKQYPDIYGIHMDKFYMPNDIRFQDDLLEVCRLAREASIGKYLSCVVRGSYSSKPTDDFDFKKALELHYLDEVVGIVSHSKNESFNEDLPNIFSEINNVALFCFMTTPNNISERVTALRTINKDIIFFSYGAYGFNTTKQEFLDMVKNGYN